MKYFLFYFLFFASIGSLASDEYRLSLEQKIFQKPHQLVFFVKKSEIRRWQNSNLFSASPDLRLGEMVVAKTPEQENIYKKLQKALEHYSQMNEQLKSSKKTTNDLIKIRPHQKVFRLNQYIVDKDDFYFKELNEIFEILLKKDAEILEGVKMSQDTYQVHFYSKKKEQKAAPLSSVAQCNLLGEKNVCTLEKFGVLVLSNVK